MAPLELKDSIKAVAFDADDTLWENERFFRNVEAQMCQIMAPFGTTEEVAAHLFQIEMDNMPDYGYGAVAFTMSLIESAIKFSHGKISAESIGQIIEHGRTLVRLKATPLPGVTNTLQQLQQAGNYTLVVCTKGELLTQENKLKRSGLLPFFQRVFIVSDKNEVQYRELCDNLSIYPHELLMVGNSLKSDILPVLNIGGYGAYIPSEVMWQHEIIEPFQHERMLQLTEFQQLTTILL